MQACRGYLKSRKERESLFSCASESIRLTVIEIDTIFVRQIVGSLVSKLHKHWKQFKFQIAFFERGG